MTATLTSKGQITIPKKIRDSLQVKTGDQLDFLLGGDDSVRVVPRRTSITQLKGIVPRPKTPVTLAAMEHAITRGAIE